MVSPIMDKFSSKEVLIPSVTCRSQDLPKIVTQVVPAAKIGSSMGSLIAWEKGRRVEQKGTS